MSRSWVNSSASVLGAQAPPDDRVSRAALIEDVLQLAECSRLVVLHRARSGDLESVAADYLALARPGIPRAGYRAYSAQAVNCIARFHTSQGNEATRVLLRLVLLAACIELVRTEEYLRLPERIFLNHTAMLVRIAATTDCDASWLNPDHDLFHKEFGLASLRLIAAENRVVDANSAIPRSVVWKSGIWSCPRNFAVFFRLGGFSPYLQTHVHDLTMSRITEGNRIQFWLSCAEILRDRPALKGMFGASWLEDPALEFAAPRLYLANRVPRDNGAIYVPMGTDEETVGNALRKSASRQSLYDNGQYLPQRYLMIWPRARVIEWADRWISENPDHPGVASAGA